MENEPDKAVEKRLAILETKTDGIFKIIPMMNTALASLGQAHESHAPILLMLWNGHIAVLKCLALSAPGFDDKTRQDFLRQIAQMESQSERIEAILSSLKQPPKNPPSPPPGT